MAEPAVGDGAVPVAAHGHVPTIVVDDIHVIYRVHGAGGGATSPVAALRRMVTGTRSPTIREVHALKGVSFASYEGEAIGIVGSNGSGKSTLLRTMAGLLPPNRGAVYTKGQPSLLGVNAALLSDLSGERNAMLGCLAMGMSRAEARRLVPEIIEYSGINERGDFGSLPMRTYSSGMAARLRFAIASAKSHEVLLIDEALATGDAKFRVRSEERIKKMREEAGTVILVSHQTSTVRDTCERTIWLEAGIIRMDGPTGEVVDAYERFTRGG